ncbi:MAG TPA: tetratricopeptide repeat protein [Actinophytocola sp.]|nr:tetratricopeptide repeat protein [Actinophytocola sp.]
MATPAPDYIPRREESAILEQADLVAKDRRSAVVLLYGVGGVGKTRMMRSLADRDTGSGPIRWVRPLDVDDSEYWLLENLQRDVATSLDPHRVHFGPFFDHLSTMSAITGRRIGRDTVASQYRRMREVFADCYADFVASTGATVVISLDTVEAVRSTYFLVNLTQWINTLPGTLFVLSGRPDPGWGSDDPIREHLADLRGGPRIVALTMAGFTDEEAYAFLDRSVLGRFLPEVYKRRIVPLTEGHPLWLALAVDYLRRADPPPEMTDTSVSEEDLRESFRRRLVTPYRGSDFWSEATKRLAVVRHSVDQYVWRELMADRELPPDVPDWDAAWAALRARPWIRPRANANYVTLHDALAEELALRLIPLYDQDETWRRGLWETAVAAYETRTVTAYPELIAEMDALFDSMRDDDAGEALSTLAELDVRKRQLDHLRAAGLHYLLLTDFPAGTTRFSEQFGAASARNDLHYMELVCHELEMFLPIRGRRPAALDAVGVVVERFRAWLDDDPTRLLGIGLDIARFLIQNAQPKPAADLLDGLPEAVDSPELVYRLANEKGNARMRIPGQVANARTYFDQALERAERFDSPQRERFMAEAWKELGYYSRNLGRWEDADEQYGHAREVMATIVGPAGDLADRAEMASIQTNWAYLKALQGYYDEARDLVESALVVRQRLNRTMGTAISLSTAGEVHRYDRKFREAWEHYGQAEALFVSMRDPSWLGQVYQEQAICLLQAYDAGVELESEPVERAKALILQAVDICREHAVRAYPSALNRAGRIFGREDADRGLAYLEQSITEAKRVADGWFLSASLIEFLELSYEEWTRTQLPRYRENIESRAAAVADAIKEYRFADLGARWDLLRGHLGVHDALETQNQDDFDTAVRTYATGFLALASRRVGSHGAAAIAAEFRRFRGLFERLPEDVQHEWYTYLRREWSRATEADRSTSLLARLEQLY